MKGVLHIALGFFSVLPLQRGLTVFGAALMGIGALVALAGSFHYVPPLAALGALYIALTPIFAGGVLMRYASSRILLHQRPRGRLKQLLGATLAVTITAGLLTLFLWLTRRNAVQEWPALGILADSWSVVALLWIVQFVGSRSPASLALIVLGLVGLRTLGGAGPHVSPPGAAPGWLVLLPVAAVAWTGFCAWYLSVRTIHRAHWFDRPLSPRSANEDASLSGTQVYLTGTFTQREQVINGAACALLLAILPLAVRKTFPDAPVIPPVALPLLALSCTAAGLRTVARARSLWLRAGTDRVALFALAERQALRSGMTTLVAGIAIFLLVSIAVRPGYALPCILFALSQLAFGVCMFYGGLSLTNGRGSINDLPGLGLVFLLQLAAALGATFAYPPRDVASVVSCIALLLAVLLVPLLRRQARRRWRGLDWRITALPPDGVPSATHTR